MSNYSQIGACGPQYGYGYPAYYGGGGGYPALAPYAGLGGPVQWDIVGQDPPAPAQESFMDKAKRFGQQETLGIKNQNLALGAIALGGIYWAYKKRLFR